jgi:hypothetical protein
MAGSSFLDKAKEIGLKARDTVAKTSDKIDGAVERAADFVDTKTKGKYSDRIGKAKSAAHDALEKLDETPDVDTDRPDGPAGPRSSEPTGPAAATPDPPVAPPDPGLHDTPRAGPSDVAEGPPVAKPDPGAPEQG